MQYYVNMILLILNSFSTLTSKVWLNFKQINIYIWTGLNYKTKTNYKLVTDEANQYLYIYQLISHKNTKIGLNFVPQSKIAFLWANVVQCYLTCSNHTPNFINHKSQLNHLNNHKNVTLYPQPKIRSFEHKP